MDKLGSKPLNQLTEAELRVELQQTRNALSEERQKRRDLQDAYYAALAVEKEWQERERQPWHRLDRERRGKSGD